MIKASWGTTLEQTSKFYRPPDYTGPTVPYTTRSAPQPARAESVYVKYRGEVDLKFFDCTDITRSSLINRICYDRSNEYMLISLNGTFYHYCEIDASTVSFLLNAPSMGKFFIANIKGNFDCRKNRVPEYLQEPDANTLAAKLGGATPPAGIRNPLAAMTNSFQQKLANMKDAFNPNSEYAKSQEKLPRSWPIIGQKYDLIDALRAAGSALMGDTSIAGQRFDPRRIPKQDFIPGP